MKRYLTVAIIATGFCIACTQANRGAKDITLNSIETTGSNSEQRENETELPPLPQNQKTIPPGNEPAPVPSDWDKQIIRNARISFEVKNAAITGKAVTEAVNAAGGYIATATEVQLAGEIKHDITIRVPREKFDQLLIKLSGFADSLLQKNISSHDVTAEYIDTKARITAKEKIKEQYYSFLKQAKNIEEVLKVQQGISGLQEEIEMATGRINYIQHQSVLSTIELSFFEPLPAPATMPDPVPGFWQQMLASTISGWEMIQLLLVGLMKIWPLWTAAGVTTWLIKRRPHHRPLSINGKGALPEKGK